MVSVKSILSCFVLLIFVLSGCTTTPKPREGKAPVRIALVLGGGSARGFAHVGVIRVLEQEKIPIHLIVGTSVGSLIGGLYASDPNSLNLEWLAYSIEKDDVGEVGMTDFSQKKRLMEAGMQAARQALPKIKKLIEVKS